MWIITNIERLKVDISLEKRCFQSYSLYTNNEIVSNYSTNICAFFDGYILPRHNSVNSSIEAHICSYDFSISTIKGYFVLIRFTSDYFEIYGDRFGVLKWFYYASGDEFIISDSLKDIVSAVRHSISKEAIAIYTLTYHFTSGLTLFEGIFHNIPGQCARYRSSQLSFGCYWNPALLLEAAPCEVTIADITNSLGRTVDQMLALDDAGPISLSLTGGSDTRNLLALLLAKGQEPHLYTYGNPESVDCVIAKRISEGIKLSHSIHNIEMSDNVFANYAVNIIRCCQSLTSIHRAHRIRAVEREIEFADKMFLGTMGGEFVRGANMDDYILPSIVYHNWYNDSLHVYDVIKYCKNKGMKSTSFNIDYVSMLIENEFLCGGTVIRKHNALSRITAHLHDAQDIVLYHSVMKRVFTPFMDIDYLELLFASDYCYVNKEYIGNPIKRRLCNPKYYAEFLAHVYPLLGQYKYAGEHVPNEYLRNPYYAALVKTYRQFFSSSYPANFPLGEWMRLYVQEELPKCFQHRAICDVYDLAGMIDEVKANSIPPVESYWLKYTNPIMMKHVITEYEAT